MSTFVLKKKGVFGNYCKHARHATDVIFYQSMQPTGKVTNTKNYYIGKTQLNIYKPKVCVLPNDLAISCSRLYANPKVGAAPFCENSNSSKKSSWKLNNDKPKINDNGEYSNKCLNSRKLLNDKQSAEILDELRVIYLKKRSVHSIYMLACLTQNQKHRVQLCTNRKLLWTCVLL